MSTAAAALPPWYNPRRARCKKEGNRWLKRGQRMAKLRLSTVVDAPIEEFYRHVTGYGADGPIDEAAFEKEYGKILETDGDALITREEIVHYADEEPERLTWRCTFRYPAGRTQEAMDSSWAHRTDTFRVVNGGILWSVRWDTRVGWIKGILQWLFFRFRGRKRAHIQLLEPMVAAFREKHGTGS